MIDNADIVTLDLAPEHIELILHHADKASLGGVSRIRGEADRSENLSDDQIIGQIGHLSASLYLFDSVDPYVRAREQANANPHQGDDGSDFPDLPGIDVKTSFMRYQRAVLDYNCLVRPRERHTGTIYVQCLVEDRGDAFVNHLMGWCGEEHLPRYTTYGGAFHGAYVKPIRELFPIWELREAIRIRPEG